jgi:hypothetical protein
MTAALYEIQIKRNGLFQKSFLNKITIHLALRDMNS